MGASFGDFPDLFRAFGAAIAILRNLADLRDHAVRIAGAEHPLEEPRSLASLIGFVARWEDLEYFPRFEKALLVLYEELARIPILRYGKISAPSAAKLIVKLAWKANEVSAHYLSGVFPTLKKVLPSGITPGSLDVVLVISLALADRHAAFGSDPSGTSHSPEFLARFTQTRMGSEVFSQLGQVLELDQENVEALTNALDTVYRRVRESADFHCAVLAVDWPGLCRELNGLLGAFDKSYWTAELENDFIWAAKARPASPPPPAADPIEPLSAQEQSELERLERQIAGLAGGEAEAAVQREGSAGEAPEIENTLPAVEGGFPMSWRKVKGTDERMEAVPVIDPFPLFEDGKYIGTFDTNGQRIGLLLSRPWCTPNEMPGLFKGENEQLEIQLHSDAFLYYDEITNRIVLVEEEEGDDSLSIRLAKVISRESALGWILAHHLAVPSEADHLFQGIAPATWPEKKKEAAQAEPKKESALPRPEPCQGAVVLGKYGEPVMVKGNPKDLKSLPAHKLVKALVEAGDGGLSKGQLEPISTDYWRILKGLKESDPDWNAVIHFPGKPHGRYRIG